MANTLLKLYDSRVVIMVLSNILFIGVQNSNVAIAKSTFSPVECSIVAPFSTKMLPTPKGIKGAKCGYLNVPLNRQNPHSAHIRLAVIVIPATSSSRYPDPIVHLAGGPGGSSWIEIDTLIATGLNRNRDLVLMSQRGSMFAKPELMCPENDAQALEGLSLALDTKAYKKQYIAATNQCMHRLRKPGVDLDAYNTRENAADFADLRKALRISQWNIFGVSYGSYLAQALMFEHPQGIRTVTLDSVEPLSEANMASTAARNASEGFKHLFAACKSQSTCNTRYPHLEQTVTHLVNHLEKNPVITHVQLESNEKPFTVIIDGGSFVNELVESSFRSNDLVSMPALIEAVSKGELKNLALTRATAAAIPAKVLAYGMATSIVCSNYVADDSKANILYSGKKYLSDYPVTVISPAIHFSYIMDICKVWGVTRKPMNMHPDTSKIPTLILSGEFDAVTPPSTGMSVAKLLPNSIVQSIPGAGHGVVQSSTCAQKIMASFLSHPNAPDVSCAAEPAPKFSLSNFK